jgi:hypothetical protein
LPARRRTPPFLDARHVKRFGRPSIGMEGSDTA